MYVYARFDEIPSMAVKAIKETKRYGRTDARTHGWKENVKTVNSPTNKVCRGYNNGCINVCCKMQRIMGEKYSQ